jgi:tRNA nucleotidyltransferase (CCA-adding enzyme)
VQIIVTHDMSDFDALASAVAARRLYPGAEVVLGRRLAPPVRDFLSLHRDRFPVLRATDLNPDEVHRMIIVDVRRASRLRDFDALVTRARDPHDPLEVHIYDHHAAADDDLVGTIEHVEPVGAVTTLMVEELQHRGESLDAVEATLLALGIYADTGAFTHTGTTGRDVHAAAWLLDQGANLRVINRFLRATLSDPQRAVLGQVLEAIQVERVGHIDVGIATVALPKVVEGLALVTEEALRQEGHGALFVLYDLAGKRVQVVARGRVPYLDVGKALEPLGGGGHAGAGAVIVKGEPVANVRGRLVQALHALCPTPTRVRDLMSSPVRTVPPDMPLRQLGVCLETWDHSGVPVVRDGTMVGIVSRRDLDKARQDGRDDLPVSSCMGNRVETVTPDVPLDEALALMVTRDIGRLPVIREDKLVGIISRTDVVRAIYGDGVEAKGA